MEQILYVRNALHCRYFSELGSNRIGEFYQLGVMRVRLSLGDVVYVSDEKDHGIIEQFIPYGKVLVRLIKKGTVLKLSRGDVKKSRHN